MFKLSYTEDASLKNSTSASVIVPKTPFDFYAAYSDTYTYTLEDSAYAMFCKTFEAKHGTNFDTFISNLLKLYPELLL